MDKEIALAFINGPGTSLAFMFACLLLFFFGLYVVGVFNRADRIKFEAKQEAQRSALANVERMLTVMRQDNAVLIRKLGGIRSPQDIVDPDESPDA